MDLKTTVVHGYKLLKLKFRFILKINCLYITISYTVELCFVVLYINLANNKLS